MQVQTYRKKPREVQAVQVRDDLGELYEVAKWISTNGGSLSDPLHTFDCAFYIHTPHGDLPVNVGDWVRRDASGEFRPCPPNVFAEFYELATEGEETR